PDSRRNKDLVCSISASPTPVSVQGVGGAGRVTVTTSDQTCSVAVVSNDPWISITSPPTSLGDGSVTFTTTDNSTAAPRSGSISVGTTTVVINQGGQSCTYDAAPATYTFSATANSGSVSVAAPAGCTW